MQKLLRLVCSHLYTGTNVSTNVHRLHKRAFMAEVQIIPPSTRPDLQAMTFLCLHVAKTRRQALHGAVHRAFLHWFQFLRKATCLQATMRQRWTRAMRIHSDPWAKELSRGYKHRVPAMFGSRITREPPNDTGNKSQEPQPSLYGLECKFDSPTNA